MRSIALSELTQLFRNRLVAATAISESSLRLTLVSGSCLVPNHIETPAAAPVAWFSVVRVDDRIFDGSKSMNSPLANPAPSAGVSLV